MFKQNSGITKTHLTYVVTVICLLLLAAVVVEGQQQTQDAAINTSRSNIKNTSRLGTKINQGTVELTARSGAQSNSNEPVIKTVKIEDGKFELGVLPEGEYELRVNFGGLSSQLGGLEGRSTPTFDPLILDLEGAAGGARKQEVQLELDPKTESETARAGQAKFKSIVLKSDGTTPIKGTIRHSPAKNAIRNTQ